MSSFKPFIIIFAGLVFTSCSTIQTISVQENSTTQSTLWVQNSAEFEALTTQTYATALRTLSLPLEDSYWTASINQENTDYYSSLPPAIILDIDETILDNSPFQARMIKQGKSFNIDDWNAWCNEGKAEAIPGAVEFANYATEKGIELFYISNREHEVEEATRQNLIEQGFPVSDSLDNIMTNGEEDGWNSSKIERRKIIEENYRVVMIFGDDLNDFLPAKDITQAQRDELVDQNKEKFGRRWFMLPNPVYGSWDQALYNFDDDLTEEERQEILKNRLDSKN